MSDRSDAVAASQGFSARLSNLNKQHDPKPTPRAAPTKPLLRTIPASVLPPRPHADTLDEDEDQDEPHADEGENVARWDSSLAIQSGGGCLGPECEVSRARAMETFGKLGVRADSAPATSAVLTAGASFAGRLAAVRATRTYAPGDGGTDVS